jgi:ribose 5-phosphate isomerase B
MKIILGTDHRGFDEKNRIKAILIEKGFSVEDVGALEKNIADDFPLYAKAVAVTLFEKQDGKGILFCGSGVGMSIVANKFPSVRAGLGFNVEQVKSARHDDDINVLIIPVDFLSEEVVNEITYAFLHTPFSEEEKYIRRIKQISDIEQLTKTYE